MQVGDRVRLHSGKHLGTVIYRANSKVLVRWDNKQYSTIHKVADLVLVNPARKRSN